MGEKTRFRGEILVGTVLIYSVLTEKNLDHRALPICLFAAALAAIKIGVNLKDIVHDLLIYYAAAKAEKKSFDKLVTHTAKLLKFHMAESLKKEHKKSLN